MSIRAKDKGQGGVGTGVSGGQWVSRDSVRDTQAVDLYDRPGSYRLSDEELANEVERWANHLRQRFPDDPQAGDFGQELAVMLLDSRHKKMKEAKTDHTVTLDERRYLTTTAQNLRKKIASGRVHPNIRRAWAILHRREEEFRAANGRDVTERERQEMAEEIREHAFEPRNRPTKGWQNAPRAGSTVPLTYTGDNGSEYTNPEIATEQISVTVGFDSDAKRSERRASKFVTENARASLLRDMAGRVQTWNSLVANRPELPRRFNRDNDAAAANAAGRLLSDHGGQAVVARQYLNAAFGEDEPQVKALFHPFDRSITAREMDAWASMLQENPDNAPKIWGLASKISLDASDGRFAKRR